MEITKCSLEKEGFRGYYFPGTKEPDKAIIAVGGASCNEKTCIAASDFFDSIAGYCRTVCTD